MNRKIFKTIKLIVLLLIVVVSFFQIFKFTQKKMEEKKRDDIITNMLILQKKVKMINGETLVNVENEGIIGKKISEIENNNLKEKIKKAGVIEEDFENYYLLYMNDFDTMKISNELKRANSEEYLVSYKENEVIYIKGIEIGNKVYYKLSEILILGTE